MTTHRPLLVHQKLLLLILVLLALAVSRLFAATYTVSGTEDCADVTRSMNGTHNIVLAPATKA